MRHRIGIAAQTGLGNPDPVLLNNKGKLTKEMKSMMKEAMSLWKPLQYGMDYQLTPEQVIFGREPAYQFEPLFIISIAKDKGLSYLQTGKSFGDYGSGIRSKYKFYKDYTKKSKFIRFIDKWHLSLASQKQLATQQK